MNVLLWVLGATGSGLVGILLSVLFQDQIRIWLASRVSLLGRGKKRGIEGIWKGTFTVVRGHVSVQYVEAIEITRALGIVEGRIVPDARNYDALQTISDERPLRLRGEVGESFFLTGVWFHPLQTHRFTGAFQLAMDPSGKAMKGKWVGFSETLAAIDSGEWILERDGS